MTTGKFDRKWTYMLVIFSAVCFVNRFSALAQLPTAAILGTVRDTSGAVVPDANLTARNIDTGLTRTAASSADGSFRFSALPVGNYEVTAERPGFQKEMRSGLVLTVSQEAVVNFALEVGAVEQTVEVVAEAPLVNTTSGTLGALVNQQKVADLPLNGRNFVDLALLQPGILQQKNNAPGSTSSAGTWFSSNGAPVRSNNFLLDGAIMTNASSITAASNDGNTLGVGGIREFRVVTNAFSAEYGMTMGSQLMLVSKSGSNGFHASILEYLRNSALDARNFYDYVKDRRLPAFARNQFGAEGGGPIKKDKTFFYAVYEGLRQRLGVTTVDTVLPASAKVDGGAGGVAQIAPVIKPFLTLFPDPNLPNNRYTFPSTQPTKDDYGQIRVDESISSADSVFARYTIIDSTETDPLTYPQFVLQRQSRSQFGTVSANHIFSPILLNSARFSFSRTFPAALSPTSVTGPQFSFLAGRPIGTLSVGGLTSMGPSSTGNPSAQKQNIFTYSDDVFYTRGRQSMKFGVLINHYQDYFISSSNNAGTVNFGNPNGFLLGQPTTYTALTPGSVWDRSYHYNTAGFYGQTDFRVVPNLTINLGLRYEFQTVPRDIHGVESALRDVQHDAKATLGPVFRNMSLLNFSPRFGFAWDVRGDGKTAIRGGFGELYDIGNWGQALNIGITGTPPFASNSSVTNSTNAVLVLPLVFPASAAGKSLRTVDYNLQQPHLLSYNLAFERQLPGRIALSLAYAGSRGINVVQTVEGNPTVPQVLSSGQQFWTGTDPRTNPNWSGMEFKTAGGDSFYNALQFGLTKQLSRGLEFQSSYTWSKLIDDTQGQASGDNAVGSVFASDPTRLSVDRAVGDFDITQSWRFNAIYQTPVVISNPVLGGVLNGWRLSGILTLLSGAPFTPTLGSNRSRSGVNSGAASIDRPDLVLGRNGANIVSGTSAGCPGVSPGAKLGTPELYFDPCAFSLQAAGFLGTAGRNMLRGPGLENLDFSLVKNFPFKALGERGNLEFRTELFNILNRANFGIPARTVFSGTGANPAAILSNAGTILSTSTPSRQIQFALRLSF